MTAIEHRYFADRDFFQELEAAAERLADEYVRGVLVGSERDAIEALSCTREWRLRLALAAERVVGR